MATKKGISKLVQALRVGGCHNGQLDQDGALGILLEDWFQAFADASDDQLRDAARGWCDKPRDGKGFKPWPITADLRDILKARRSATHISPEGCPDCDFTGWRGMFRVNQRGHRTEAAAPCTCPKGFRFSNPPPAPPNGPQWDPPQPFHVVAAIWERQGSEVHVTDRNMLSFPLSLTNPESWARAQAMGTGLGSVAIRKALATMAAGTTPDAHAEKRDHARAAAGDLDDDPDAWRRGTEAPW